MTLIDYFVTKTPKKDQFHAGFFCFNPASFQAWEFDQFKRLKKHLFFHKKLLIT